MTPERLEAILARASAKRIVVVGDLMLDEFVWGKVGRISPEAPVPVVEVTGESFYPGGAANVARNLREFGGEITVVGMIGDDAGGQRLRALLDEQKIDTSHLLTAPGFSTIIKTRIIARHQQVVRVDREQIHTPDAAQVSEIAKRVRDLLAKTDAVIFEDYGKGFLTSELVREISSAAHAEKKLVAADPNPHHPLDWRDVSVVKPNRAEAFSAAGIAPRDPVEPPTADKPLLEAGKVLLEKWDTRFLLVTLGEQGMMLFQKGQPPHHIPTKARQVFDVSGAGDTAIALFALALCCDASPLEAAEIANHASAVVVGKLGTATVTAEELHASFRVDASTSR